MFGSQRSVGCGFVDSFLCVIGRWRRRRAWGLSPLQSSLAEKLRPFPPPTKTAGSFYWLLHLRDKGSQTMRTWRGEEEVRMFGSCSWSYPALLRRRTEAERGPWLLPLLPLRRRRHLLRWSGSRRWRVERRLFVCSGYCAACTS